MNHSQWHSSMRGGARCSYLALRTNCPRLQEEQEQHFRDRDLAKDLWRSHARGHNLLLGETRRLRLQGQERSEELEVPRDVGKGAPPTWPVGCGARQISQGHASESLRWPLPRDDVPEQHLSARACAERDDTCAPPLRKRLVLEPPSR